MNLGNSLKQLQHNVQHKWQSIRHELVLHPMRTCVILAAAGIAAGAGIRGQIDASNIAAMQQEVASYRDQTTDAQKQAQMDVNALAARLGELQAEVNRLNALGDRLARMGELSEGEFDFNAPVGVGGDNGPVRDMAKDELEKHLAQVDAQMQHSNQQLSVMESFLFNRELDQNALPSRSPIKNSYITSVFGTRADPFDGGAAFHKGIDFHASVGDPVLTVADGVVSFSGIRNGYGNVIEVDHGNGYVTRYAHNSKLSVNVGDLVRTGQEIAKAGSTGRSTSAHVHFEVWHEGRVMNPRKYLGEQSVQRL